MKDLSKYIETLIDNIKLPLEVTLGEGGVYHIHLIKDLKFSNVFYKIAYERDDKDIRSLRVQLKRYLPKLEFVIKVEYINYPPSYSILPVEYIIKPKK